jgi:hypothetical protein
MAESKIDQIKALLTETPEMSLSEVRKYFETKGETFSSPTYYHAKKQLDGGSKTTKPKLKWRTPKPKRSNREPAVAAKDDRRSTGSIKSVVAAHGALRQPVAEALELLGSREHVIELIQNMLG